MKQSRASAYRDAYERHYQNMRDDGWPADRAAAWAEAQATHEIEQSSEEEHDR